MLAPEAVLTPSHRVAGKTTTVADVIGALKKTTMPRCPLDNNSPNFKSSVQIMVHLVWSDPFQNLGGGGTVGSAAGEINPVSALGAA